MPDNSYLPNLETTESALPVVSSFRFAGFWRRGLAFLLDVLPITLGLAAVFYFFLGFDETVQRHLNRQPGDLEARRAFLSQRNIIRDLSFLLYLVYAAILEGSVLQGTLGKRILGLRVTDKQGQRLTFAKSIGRSAAKIVSYIPCGLGFLWVAWSKQKRGWHDLLAETLVVHDEPDLVGDVSKENLWEASDIRTDDQDDGWIASAVVSAVSVDVTSVPSNVSKENLWTAYDTRMDDHDIRWAECAVASVVSVCAAFALSYLSLGLGVLASVLGIVLACLAIRDCRRNPDAKGLVLAFASVIAGCGLLVLWYVLVAPTLLGTTAAMVGLAVLILIGVFWAISDGSDIAKYVAGVIALITLTICIVAPWIIQTRGAARRHQAMDNLRRIGIEILMDDRYNRIDTNGEPLQGPDLPNQRR